MAAFLMVKKEEEEEEGIENRSRELETTNDP